MTVRHIVECCCEDTNTLIRMNFLQHTFSSGTLHCMGYGFHEERSTSCGMHIFK